MLRRVGGIVFATALLWVACYAGYGWYLLLKLIYG